MPHKNPICKGAEDDPHMPTKMQHEKWLDETRPVYYYIHYKQMTDHQRVKRKRIVKCPRCGRETFDWMTRKVK